MKPAIRIALIFLTLPAMLLLSSCGDYGDEPIPNYWPNETIQKTFLWGKGSWWAYEDTSTGARDTIFVTEHFSTNRRVFEGDIQIHSDYTYKGTLFRTKESKSFIINYVSSKVHEYLGQTRTFLMIYSFQNNHGAAEERLFYTPWPLGDSVWVGYETHGSTTTQSYLTILEEGDSLFFENKWHQGRYYKYRTSNSMVNNFNDVIYIWQENYGLVEYNIDGKTYRLVNHFLVHP